MLRGRGVWLHYLCPRRAGWKQDRPVGMPGPVLSLCFPDRYSAICGRVARLREFCRVFAGCWLPRTCNRPVFLRCLQLVGTGRVPEQKSLARHEHGPVSRHGSLGRIVCWRRRGWAWVLVFLAVGLAVVGAGAVCDCGVLVEGCGAWVGQDEVGAGCAGQGFVWFWGGVGHQCE